MGIAIDPSWSSNHRAYVCYSTTTDNRVARFTLDPAAPTPVANWTPIVTRLRTTPVTALALGVRLRSAVQGPDGNLYVVTDGDGGSGVIWRIIPV